MSSSQWEFGLLWLSRLASAANGELQIVVDGIGEGFNLLIAFRALTFQVSEALELVVHGFSFQLMSDRGGYSTRRWGLVSISPVGIDFSRACLRVVKRNHFWNDVFVFVYSPNPSRGLAGYPCGSGRGSVVKGPRFVRCVTASMHSCIIDLDYRVKGRYG
jgi:hypothetical protein